jgi:hypothetical protein
MILQFFTPILLQPEQKENIQVATENGRPRAAFEAGNTSRTALSQAQAPASIGRRDVDNLHPMQLGTLCLSSRTFAVEEKSQGSRAIRWM